MTDPASDLPRLAESVAAAVGLARREAAAVDLARREAAAVDPAHRQAGQAPAPVRDAQPIDHDAVLAALHDLHLLREAVDQLEPELIAAARRSGVSWQVLAPVLGVASRQAAERRYLRLVPATPDQAGSTRDERVRQVRDRRAGARAVQAWANDNTADLRRLAGQITSLQGLAPSSAGDIARLHRALGEVDASALPALLAQARRHLTDHPALSRQIDAVTEHAARVRRETQQRRDGDGGDPDPRPLAVPTEEAPRSRGRSRSDPPPPAVPTEQAPRSRGRSRSITP